MQKNALKYLNEIVDILNDRGLCSFAGELERVVEYSEKKLNPKYEDFLNKIKNAFISASSNSLTPSINPKTLPEILSVLDSALKGLSKEEILEYYSLKQPYTQGGSAEINLPKDAREIATELASLIEDKKYLMNEIKLENNKDKINELKIELNLINMDIKKLIQRAEILRRDDPASYKYVMEYVESAGKKFTIPPHKTP